MAILDAVGERLATVAADEGPEAVTTADDRLLGYEAETMLDRTEQSLDARSDRD